MNRALIFGIALFVAIVGIALISADTTAVAGHKCKCKCNDCCEPSCCAPVDCCPPPPSCCGCAGAPAAAAVAPANPVAQRSQFGFRTVSFQR